MDKKIVTLAGAIYIAWLMVSAGSDFIAHFEMLEKTRGGGKNPSNFEMAVQLGKNKY